MDRRIRRKSVSFRRLVNTKASCSTAGTGSSSRGHSWIWAPATWPFWHWLGSPFVDNYGLGWPVSLVFCVSLLWPLALHSLVPRCCIGCACVFEVVVAVQDPNSACALAAREIVHCRWAGTLPCCRVQKSTHAKPRGGFPGCPRLSQHPSGPCA